MSRIRTLIVDDEPLARLRLRRQLQGEPDVDVVGECDDGSTVAAAVGRQHVDLVLMDVQMPMMDGFEALRRIDATRLPLVVFVTAYDQYAIRAFEIHAIDYLLKPVQQERLRAALVRIRAALGRRSVELEQLTALLDELRGQTHGSAVPMHPPRPVERVLISLGKRRIPLRLADVDWVEAADNYVRFHVGDKALVHRQTLAQLERELDPGLFARIHRSTIVNLDRVREIVTAQSGDSEVILHDGTRLRLSRSYRHAFSFPPAR